MNQRSRRIPITILSASVALAGLMAAEQDAWALQGGEDAELLPVLVDKRFGAAGRHQLGVAFSTSMASKFVEGTGVYLTYDYNFTDMFGVEAGVGYIFGREAKIMQQVRAGIGGLDPESLSDLFQMQLITSVDFMFVPFYGKMSFASEVDPGYDLFMVAGAGFTTLRKQQGSAVVNPTAGQTFETSGAPLFNFGAGLRFYVTKLVALRVEMRDYFFVDPTDFTHPTDERLSQKGGMTHNLHVQAGVQLNFGGDQ